MIRLPEMDPAKASDEIGDFVIDKVESVGAKGCVIGLSGGVDSSVTAGVIQRAFVDKRYELVGYMVPSKLNDTKDIEDAQYVADFLGIRSEIVDISQIVDAYRSTNPEAFANKYDQGNMISRIRANVLNTKAATEGKVLAGTGNKDEDFGIGYYTLFGDGAVHMSPIGNLSKRLVTQMAEYLGFDERITRRTPAAGLEPGQTDFKDLGYGYDLVEMVTCGIEQGLDFDEIMDEVAPMAYDAQERYGTLFKEAKFPTITDMVSDIYRRHSIANQKVQIINPPVAPVTLRYEDEPLLSH